MHARNVRKGRRFKFENQDHFVGKVQNAARRFVARKKSERNKVRMDLRRESNRCNEGNACIQRVFRGHLDRKKVASIRSMKMLEPLDYDGINRRRLEEKSAYLRSVEVT